MNHSHHQQVSPNLLLTGALTFEQMRDFIFAQWSSQHQWQKCCDRHVTFISHTTAIYLDHAAMSSVVTWIEVNHPVHPALDHLRTLLSGIAPEPKIVPKPEPEVAVRLAQKMPDPEPEPRWTARIRFKMHHGGTSEHVVLIDEVSELEDIIERGPAFGDCKNVKIKLEYRLG